MYYLIEYSNNFMKISGSLWQYYKDEPNDYLVDSNSFNSKVKITASTPAGSNIKDIKLIVPLKYLSIFWRTCKVNLILTCSSTCVITNSTSEGKFIITDTKICVPVVTSSTENNVKPGFKRTIN